MNKYIITMLVVATVFVFVLGLLMLVFKNQLLVKKRVDALFEGSNKESLSLKKVKANRERKYDTKVKFLKKLANELSLSGVLIRPSEFLFIWAVSTLIPPAVALVLTNEIIVALGVLIIGLFLPPFIVHRGKAKRVELFEKQLVDGLAIICNSLRSGLTFQQALVSISNEMPEPISKEFGRVIRETNLGISIEKALNNMSERLNSKSLMLIVSAVLIQRQVGGNLSEILSNIAGTIKERYKIKNDIKVLTTTGRSSGTLIGIMPIGIALIFMLINPGYIMKFLESPIGIAMLIAAAFLEIIGFLIINKIVNVKY